MNHFCGNAKKFHNMPRGFFLCYVVKLIFNQIFCLITIPYPWVLTNDSVCCTSPPWHN